MTSKDKLRQRAQNNPAGITFKDFQRLLKQCGWTFDHQTGSHQVWYSPTALRISIQPRSDGKAKAYQVKQFILQQDRETDMKLSQ